VDIIVDGADNFPHPLLVNDASVWRGIPVVHGSIYRFEGRSRCSSPTRDLATAASTSSAPELAPSCSEGGVLGVLPASWDAPDQRVLKPPPDGEPLVGRLLLFDALTTDFTEVKIRRNPDCPVCGEHPTVTEYIDYVEFCTR
jgi:adenylyltransferase/sulfurtransferase